MDAIRVRKLTAASPIVLKVSRGLGSIDRQPRKRHVRRRTVVHRQPHEGQRKGSSLDLRHGALSRDLYKEQRLKLLDMSGDIRAFIVATKRT